MLTKTTVGTMPSKPDSNIPEHFEGKEALQHVVEKYSDGFIAASESHGTETPGSISSFADSCKETAFFLSLAGLCFYYFPLTSDHSLILLFTFSIGLFVWKTGRSAWLGWSRMERLHRLVEQERWEIQHHRPQEREELYALYRIKGFEGQLLEEVVDVLMADEERLLRVMLEEEMGLRLECYEHPLKQAASAAMGSFLASILCLLGLYISPTLGISCFAILSIVLASTLSAIYEKNQLVPAIIWNVSILLMVLGTVYFSLEYALKG